MEKEYSHMQLINGEGEFNVAGVDKFMRLTKFSKYGRSYGVLAIMGPQSSGKSTLLNHLFGTKFKEMDAYEGRNQTTQGIWISKYAGEKPCTIVMDLEGTDGSERGEDDTAFERQSALFALATADILIINMWCHDVGRERAANKPLLRKVFQVMLNIIGAPKIKLLFVLRDKTKTPLDRLEHMLRNDAKKIWDSVHKHTSHVDTSLSNFFNVDVVALSSYEQSEEQFNKEVAQLRGRLLEELTGDRQDVIPASEFFVSAKDIWKRIKENKDLDLPALKIMVATVRCEKIVNKKLDELSYNKDWLALKRATQSGQFSSFGSKLSSILETIFSEYEKEAFHFDEGVKNDKRKLLELKALDFVRPSCLEFLKHLPLETLKNFKSRLEEMLYKGAGFAASAKYCADSEKLEFDQACADAAIRYFKWETSDVRKKLFQDIDSSKTLVREEILTKWKVTYEEKLQTALSKQLDFLFENPDKDTWASIRKLLTSNIEIATSEMSARISVLELAGDQKSNKMIQDLRDYGRSIVERKAREEANVVLKPMTTRFVDILNKAIERKSKERAIRNARTESLRVLSVMAAIRLEEKPDKIEKMLLSSLTKGSLSLKKLSSSTWPEVSPKDTMIKPEQCNSIWEQFEAEILTTIQKFIELKGNNTGRFKAIAKTTLEVAGVAIGIASLVTTIVVAPHVGIAVLFLL
ncbi:hypothetical protein REPUB_Repub02eG0272300 [Reevesia pubescens]